MASGKMHYIADVSLTIASIPIVFYYPEHLLQIVIGNVIGTLMTPDCDSENSTYNEILLANTVRTILIICGRKKAKATNDVKIIYRLQAALTAAYGVMIPHRSWLSHFPIVSTLTITYYLWLLYFVSGKVATFQTFDYMYLIQTYQIAMIVIAIHHAVHYVMDGGLILFMGKQVYTLSYPFYYLTTKLFPQGKND